MIDSITAQLAQNGNILSSNKTVSQNEGMQSAFEKILAAKQTDYPYAHLAKDGVINYNGVTFICDPQTHSINLGDMSNPKNVLNINLPSGGHLNINVNNFGDISKCVGMFSPEDLNAIMTAIYEYNLCKAKLNEMEDEKSKVMNSVDDE